MNALHPTVEEILPWLGQPAEEIDETIPEEDASRIIASIDDINGQARAGDQEALYQQQFLLARIYDLSMRIPDAPSAEGSVLIHTITRRLERATIAAEDSWIPAGALEAAPADPTGYLSWLKQVARRHRVFKHHYYTEFIRNHATQDHLRTYVMQESVVDGRFDDLLAMMQVGTNESAKLEIANNFWDEMGNGNPEQIHTTLFNRIYDVFQISGEELERALTANALLSGNLAVLLCRYRQFYPEAVGFLGMTEWLVPDRFVQVVTAWERLGLPDVGIVYHRLHITVDSQHAAGWFHNVVIPAATSEFMRRGITRGTLWRLNSSARYLDERLAEVADLLPARP